MQLMLIFTRVTKMTYQSSPYLEKNKAQSPVLIQQEYWAFINRHPHWHDHQKLKEQPDQYWNDKNLGTKQYVREKTNFLTVKT